jgi:hypothetical protein
MLLHFRLGLRFTTAGSKNGIQRFSLDLILLASLRSGITPYQPFRRVSSLREQDGVFLSTVSVNKAYGLQQHSRVHRLVVVHLNNVTNSGLLEGRDALRQLPVRRIVTVAGSV